MARGRNPTRYDLNDAKATIEHVRTLVRNLDYCDTPSSYYSKVDEIGIAFSQFQNYEKRGIRFSMKTSTARRKTIKELEKAEAAFIDRAYKRCERDSQKYKTRKGVINCYERFFSEMMFYVNKIYPSNYKYLLKLEDHVAIYFNSQQ
jgi:hypothetical protein